MDNNNSTSNNSWGFATKVFEVFPKWLKIFFGVILFGAAIYLGYNYFMPKISKQENQIINKPFIATIVGQLIEKKSHKPLTNVSVGEESNPIIKDESVDDGTYILEKITIPDSKIISLVVTYPDGTIESVKDIDVSQISPDIDGRIMIPNKEVKDVEIASQKVEKVNRKTTQSKVNNEFKDNSKQIIIPENKGTINIK